MEVMSDSSVALRKEVKDLEISHATPQLSALQTSYLAS
jgi:hypothetical protein